MGEAKRLVASISAARAELNKYEEQLEDSRKYKEFLSSLTPPEWFEQRAAAKAAARAAAKEGRRAARMAQVEETRARRRAEILEETKGQPKEDIEAALRALADIVLPDNWDDGFVEPPEEAEEMYFTHPRQLLQVFAALEEQNLFLIQSSQETEEQLEDLRTKFRETKARMEAETEGLQAQVAALEAAIALADAKAASLRDKVNAHTKQEQGGGGVSLEELKAKVSEVYVRCGFEADSSISTLQMLANIESRLEEYLATVGFAQGFLPRGFWRGLCGGFCVGWDAGVPRGRGWRRGALTRRRRRRWTPCRPSLWRAWRR